MQNKSRVLILGECCANHYIANRVSEIFNKNHRIRAESMHDYKQGRDRILSSIDRMIKKYKESAIIAIIDFEKGEVARKYIDNYFDKYEIDSRILLGISKRYGKKVVAVIFDPNIEEALICLVSKEVCSDKSKLNKVKSNKCEDILNKMMDKSPLLHRKVEKIVNTLIGYIEIRH